MATEGDKIAAATLAAELLRRGITAHSVENAINLYRELLRQIERVAPPTEQQMDTQRGA